MLVLGINTVMDVCEAALVRNGELVLEMSEPMAQGHDARLAPLVEELMHAAGIAFADLNRIAVAAGPGSFTGVRVGVAFARGLALALEAPAAGVTSLEALGPPEAERVLAVLPAKRRPPQQSWWAQIIEGGHGLSEPTEADATGLMSLAEGCSALWGQMLEDAPLALPHHHARPRAAIAARLVAGMAVEDLAPPRPIYVRQPDAKPMARP